MIEVNDIVGARQNAGDKDASNHPSQYCPALGSSIILHGVTPVSRF